MSSVLASNRSRHRLPSRTVRPVVAPPRRHLVRYAGVFGPASQRRAQLRALVPALASGPPPQLSAERGAHAPTVVQPDHEPLRKKFRATTPLVSTA